MRYHYIRLIVHAVICNVLMNLMSSAVQLITYNNYPHVVESTRLFPKLYVTRVLTYSHHVVLWFQSNLVPGFCDARTPVPGFCDARTTGKYSPDFCGVKKLAQGWSKSNLSNYNRMPHAPIFHTLYLVYYNTVNMI